MLASRHPARPGPDPAAAQSAHAHGDALGYLRGLLWSLALTALPFAIVLGGWLPRQLAVPAVLVLAVAQMAVHLVYFLHLRTAPGERWTLMAFLFTAVVVGIVVIGSLWVMQNLDANMMPGI